VQKEQSMMKIQLNHPGKQKPFNLKDGYRQIGDQIIREWNNDNEHYRKFIQNSGCFLNGLKDLNPTQAELYFWGEWEGNSVFNPFAKADYNILPNGVHKPFHSTVVRGLQNTDPYVFGEEFKYCVCKQTGQLKTLVKDDLILFGTVMPSLNKFYIDTVFVVKDHDLSADIQKTNGKNYSQAYRETTLEQLQEYLQKPMSSNENEVSCGKTGCGNNYRDITKTNENKVYRGKTWWDDKDYFSFVPCKEQCGDAGFERLYVELDNQTFQPFANRTGVSYLEKCELSSKDLWKEIVKIAIKQGFTLGVKFNEPELNDVLTK
jgi:hypothetical protein